MRVPVEAVAGDVRAVPPERLAPGVMRSELAQTREVVVVTGLQRLSEGRPLVDEQGDDERQSRQERRQPRP